jgi:N utilization substance protein A
MEAPEAAHGTVVFKAIAREAGSRSKVAVASTDPHVDPVGSLVGQRGVRVSTVTSELGGEKIDIVEWSEDIKSFIEEALSPARVSLLTSTKQNTRQLSKLLRTSRARYRPRWSKRPPCSQTHRLEN